MTNTKRIEAYSISDFVTQIQEAVLEGWRLNLEDNEKYPLQIGVGFYATLDKVEGELVTRENADEIIQEMADKVGLVNTSKQGRKPKV